MLGTRFRIGEEVYDSLQEIADRYIVPCDKLTKEAINHPKFKDSLTGGLKSIEVSLRNEKKSNPAMNPYCFTISPNYPQFLILIYIPKEKIITEYIKVKPKGLFFHDAYHPNISFLISWFKRHYNSRNYLSQLNRSKAPEIDTRNYLAVPGKAEKPMTPIHRMDNDYMPSTPKRTPERSSYQKEGTKPKYEEMRNYDEDRRRDRQSDNTRPRGAGRGRVGDRRDTRTCHKCGGEGHIARDCPKSQAEKCFNCGGEGHFARECLEPKKDTRRSSEGETDTQRHDGSSEDPLYTYDTSMEIDKEYKNPTIDDPWA